MAVTRNPPDRQSFRLLARLESSPWDAFPACQERWASSSHLEQILRSKFHDLDPTYVSYQQTPLPPLWQGVPPRSTQSPPPTVLFRARVPQGKQGCEPATVAGKEPRALSWLRKCRSSSTVASISSRLRSSSSRQIRSLQTPPSPTLDDHSARRTLDFRCVTRLRSTVTRFRLPKPADCRPRRADLRLCVTRGR